ncbi:VOC family protein [Streptomyces rimosus]|uniref:VOC family protein n=1 Tax=Streptomyces rimosus TaxID=1927 RepID=UPI0004C10F20|nr:VOC family protein [Streptomyces rimosus]
MLTSLRPVICTSRLEESREFYTQLFGFKVTHETAWYVGLGRPGPPPGELALLDDTHPALPGPWRRPLRTARLTLEVECAKGELERIAVCGGPASGRCRGGTGSPVGNDLFVTDPSGVLIHVVALR